MNTVTNRSRMPGVGLGAAVASMFAALCCILPMAFMVAGLGGAWVAIFGKIAAISPYVIAITALIVMVSWYFVLKNKISRTRIAVLTTSTGLTGLAMLVLGYETRLNDMLISWM